MNENRSPYSGFTLSQVVAILGMSAPMINQSGILAKLPYSSPFGDRYRLYDPESVWEWQRRVTRHRALIAFGRRVKNAPILSAPEGDDADTECPTCGGFAVQDMGAGVTERIEILNEDNPTRAWCPNCGIQQGC